MGILAVLIALVFLTTLVFLYGLVRIIIPSLRFLGIKSRARGLMLAIIAFLSLLLFAYLWSINSARPKKFANPVGIFVDRKGRIYVGDAGHNRIVRMNDMTSAGWTTLGTRGAGINQFDLPNGIFVHGEGRIYVADRGNNRIVRMSDITGAGWTTLGTQGSPELGRRRAWLDASLTLSAAVAASPGRSGRGSDSRRSARAPGHVQGGRPRCCDRGRLR